MKTFRFSRRFLALLLATFSITGTGFAQKLAWATDFPVPPNYVCELFSTILLPDSAIDSSPHQFSADDGFGGSVWIAILTPNSFEETHIVRLLWLDSKGVSIFTNDVVTSKRQFGPPTAVVGEVGEFNMSVTRFSKNELAVQMKSSSDDGSVETNILRRITKAGRSFVVTDTPLSDRQVILPETRATTDKFGFFSHELHGEPRVWTNLVIRRFTNK